MATISGISESFVPGDLEYKRVEFDISKDKYYKPERTSILFLAGFGDIPGNQQTGDQRKASLVLESRVEDQVEFEILTHAARLTQQTTFVTGNLTTGTAGTAKTFTVADASILRPYDIIQNMTTGEQLLVTAVDTSASPDEITAYPGFNSTGFSGNTSFPPSLSVTAATTKTNGDVVRIVGTAFPEGSNAGSIIDSRPVSALNYMQIFREEFGLTYEEMNTVKNGRMELSDKDERAKGDLLVKLEKAIVESKINKVSISGTGTVRSMQGIKGIPSTYNQAASSLIGGGTELTIPKLDQIADQLSGANLSGKLIAVCGGTAIRKLRELMDNKVEVNVAVGSEDFGIRTFRYESQFLPIDFVRHDIFDATGNSDEILFIDPAHLELVNLRGSEMGYVSEKKGLASGTADNDKMAMQDAHYGVYSLDYRHEAAHSLVTGLTYTIAS